MIVAYGCDGGVHFSGSCRLYVSPAVFELLSIWIFNFGDTTSFSEALLPRFEEDNDSARFDDLTEDFAKDGLECLLLGELRDDFVVNL